MFALRRAGGALWWNVAATTHRPGAAAGGRRAGKARHSPDGFAQGNAVPHASGRSVRRGRGGGSSGPEILVGLAVVCLEPGPGSDGGPQTTLSLDRPTEKLRRWRLSAQATPSVAGLAAAGRA